MEQIFKIVRNYLISTLLSLSIFLPILFLILLTFLCSQRFRHFRTFSQNGIPGPKPSFWTGNMAQLRPLWSSTSVSPIHALSTWRKQYGSIYGYFSGSRPILVISELDLVQEILTKKQYPFRDRPPLVIKLDPIPHTLVGLRGERWGVVRSQLSPIFSTKSLKSWGEPHTKKCVQVLESILDDKISTGNSGQSVEINIWPLFQGLTCDVISKCALAMEVNSQHDNENDPFLQTVRGFLRNALNPGIIFALCFPSVGKVLELGMKVFGGGVSQSMTKMIMTSVRNALDEKRKQGGGNNVDVLQLMLNSGKLSDSEIIANAWVFILGGFETTASALTFSTFLLAKHENVQDKLGAELEAAFGEDQIPSYDQIQKLPYLDQVVSECLRLYPPVVTFISRYVSEDVTLTLSDRPLHLKKGWTLQIPIWEIHRDPKLWPEPETFRPERFNEVGKVREKVNSSSRHPMAYIPWGAGGRSCIGARFATMEIKMGLAHIFSKFRVSLPPGSKGWEPKLTIPTVTLVPGEDINLIFTRRNKANFNSNL